jgi:hypothetical protein
MYTPISNSNNTSRQTYTWIGYGGCEPYDTLRHTIYTQLRTTLRPDSDALIRGSCLTHSHSLSLALAHSLSLPSCSHELNRRKINVRCSEMGHTHTGKRGASTPSQPQSFKKTRYAMNGSPRGGLGGAHSLCSGLLLLSSSLRNEIRHGEPKLLRNTGRCLKVESALLPVAIDEPPRLRAVGAPACALADGRV